MKRLLAASFVLALFVPAFAMAQSAFNGTWVTRLDSVHGMGNITIHLRNGMYECNCSAPPLKVKADGAFHTVAGHPGFDAAAVAIVNDHTINIKEKRADKVTLDQTVTVAPDGKTATFDFTDSSGSSPVTGKGVVDRVAKGASGSNAVAGTWKFGHWESLSDNARSFTYKADGNTVSYSDPTGDSYTAQIGGKAVPYDSESEPGMTVSVKKVGRHGLRETYFRGGKVISTDTMTVSASGKTMKSVDHNRQTGRGTTVVADKQ
jgi:hypothetical protein